MMEKTRKYAVVDLEATSAGSRAKIIQVGIVLIENGVITERYATDVNPHQPLDSHIIDLTGLTDQRLAEAPDFQQVARSIYQLVEGAIFVAHNVKFDANLLAEELFWAGFDLRTPRVDTVDLAQVFFPTLDKYSLGHLSDVLGLELSQAHTAIADAEATAQLFLKIQEKIASLPKALVERLLLDADCLLYESRLVIQDVYDSMGHQERKDLLECQGIFLKKQAPALQPRHLSQDFETNLALLGLDVREQQAAFAAYVEQSLEESVPTFVQAQTGVGKTYGYLLPLLAKSRQQLLVTVPTKLLQDQLLANEGSKIQEVFGLDFHKLKSPQHYIKLERFHEILHQEFDNRLWNRTKLQVLVWLTETETGDMEEIGQKHRFESLFTLFSHDGQLSRKSLFYGEDFWQLSQQRAQSSRVLVANHAYFLTRLEDDSSLLDGKILVVDEAQKLFSSLENLSRKSLSMTKCLQEISDLLASPFAALLERRILESLQFELTNQIQNFQLTGQAEFSDQLVSKLKQDLLELPEIFLADLREIVLGSYEQFWLAEEVFSDHKSLTLEAARLDLLDFHHLLPDNGQILLVSATLEISRKVNLASLLGFPAWVFHKLPTKPSAKQKIWLDTDFPEVTDLSSHDYAQAICHRLESLFQLDQPMLVLFTSKDLLLRVSDQLTLPHLAQYKNGVASNIKRRFDRGEARLLLGTGSFWEGTDFVEQDQMIQVITRLPFDNPADLFVQKINRHLRQQKKNPFYDYSLPLAILRLRQALGRTRRREDQRSAVVLLDNRVRTKRYSRQIRQSLQQDAGLENLPFEQILSAAREFFTDRKKGTT